MCGICGYVSRQSIRVDELTEMNNTMIHRGPDDAGVEIYPMKDGYSIGLAQRRLSIMDLSALGHQPMHSADHRVSIVYNGEISGDPTGVNGLSVPVFVRYGSHYCGIPQMGNPLRGPL